MSSVFFIIYFVFLFSKMRRYYKEMKVYTFGDRLYKDKQQIALLFGGVCVDDAG